MRFGNFLKSFSQSLSSRLQTTRCLCVGGSWGSRGFFSFTEAPHPLQWTGFNFTTLYSVPQTDCKLQACVRFEWTVIVMQCHTSVRLVDEGHMFFYASALSFCESYLCMFNFHTFDHQRFPYDADLSSLPGASLGFMEKGGFVPRIWVNVVGINK